MVFSSSPNQNSMSSDEPIWHFWVPKFNGAHFIVEKIISSRIFNEPQWAFLSRLNSQLAPMSNFDDFQWAHLSTRELFWASVSHFSRSKPNEPIEAFRHIFVQRKFKVKWARRFSMSPFQFQWPLLSPSHFNPFWDRFWICTPIFRLVFQLN